ncbi:hypothetical protein DW076_17510 [Clostridium sp. AF46-12NS]|nr:hypothetical protein DW076_17510 [Clostridium sp. AF46-12NS]
MLQDSRPSAKKLLKFINSGKPEKSLLDFDIFTRPSAKKLLKFINSGKPEKSLLDFDIFTAENLMRCDPLFINSGKPEKSLLDFDIFTAENLMRCDPLSLDNHEAYQKIAAALHASGAQFAAHSIDTALSKMHATSAPPVDNNKMLNVVYVSVPRATL